MRFCLVLLFAAVVSGCVATKPIFKLGQTGQIVDVEVAKASAGMGTRNLAEDIRVKTQNEAYRYSETGPEKTLKVEVIRFQAPSAGAALFVSTGSSSIHAAVTVIDKETGAKSPPVEVWAQNFRTGGIIGALAASMVDPIEDERRLATQLAEKIVLQVYGDEAAKRVENRTPTRQAEPDYPVSYAEESKRLECRDIRIQNTMDDETANEQGQEPTPRTLPDYCGRFPAETS